MLLSFRLGRFPTLQAAATNNPPLMEGQTNDGIGAVQDLLRDLGYVFAVSFKEHKPDGIFGTETKANVEAFQRKSGLKPDGIAGRLTLEKLDELIIKNEALEEHSRTEVLHNEAKNRALPPGRRNLSAT
jgi:peptidoglycan hydrolase-like protein with peptidoglycan-binding domain